VSGRLPRIALCLIALAGLYGCSQSVGFASLSDGKGTFVTCYGDRYASDHEPQASIAKREACVAACTKNGFHVIDASSNSDSIEDRIKGEGVKDTPVPAQCR
jgi:hypothetical protein